MANLAVDVEYLEYDFSQLFFRTAATAIAATGAATNKLSATAHGLVNGDVVSLSDIVTLTNVATGTRYYVIAATADDFQIATTPGGSAIAIGNSGSANVLSFLDVEVRYPNQATAEPATTSYEWKGGGKTVNLDTLTGLKLNLDIRSIPSYAHSVLFNKGEIAMSGADNAIGFGGGSDKSGVTVGLLAYRNAKKIVNGSEVGVVTRFYEYPAGTLTLRTAPGIVTGEVGGMIGYSFSATPGDSDINGAAIVGMDAEDFFIHGELV